MTRAVRVLDGLAMVVSVALIGGVSYWLWKDKVLALSLLEYSNPVWYLIRSAGVMSFALLTLSVIWGLFLSSRIVKDWSPGPVSMMLHSTISWLALLFGLGHGLLLMLDNYVPYKLNEVLVPFIGPYRPEAVGLGTLAFWLLLAISLSFPLKRRIGHRAWKLLHLTSYATYLMAVAHAVFAGTDSAQPGFRVFIGASVCVVLALSAYRVMKRGKPVQAASARSQRKLDVKAAALADAGAGRAD